MPTVRFKGPIEEIRGTLYDVVFKRSSTGKMIVSKRPDMSNANVRRTMLDGAVSSENNSR